MKALLALTLLLSPPVLAQCPCVGWVLDSEMPGNPSHAAGTAVEGDRVAVHRFRPFNPNGPGVVGSIDIHRLLPDRSGFELVDSAPVPYSGVGFAQHVYGIALAGDSVLIAKRQPSPTPAEYIQLRRVAGAWTATTLPSSGPYVQSDGWRRFDADAGRAVSVLHVGQSAVLDFFSVDANGDWSVEDTQTVPGISLVYQIHDVSLRGDIAMLESFSAGNLRIDLWRRTPGGTWVPFAPPPLVLDNSFRDAFISGNTLAATYSVGTQAWLELWDRQLAGTWVQSVVQPLPTPVGATTITPPIALEMDGDVIGVAGPNSMWLAYRRSAPNALTPLAEVASPLPHGRARLQGEVFARLSIGGAFHVLPRADLGGRQRLCVTRGRPVCTGQQAGELRYERDYSPCATSDELVLVNATPASFAYVVGSTDLTPTAGALNALCVGGNGPRIRFPNIGIVQADGSARWTIDSAALPATGGPLSGVGRTLVFQAVVRTGPVVATSDALWVQL